MNNKELIADNRELRGEVWRLRELIDEAPHGEDCIGWEYAGQAGVSECGDLSEYKHYDDKCNCWKSEVDSQDFYDWPAFQAKPVYVNDSMEPTNNKTGFRG